MNSKIDLSYLEEVTGGNTDIIKEMLELFLSETPQQIQLIQEKCKLKEWQGVSAEAHKLKPTFLYVGLQESNEKLTKIEHGARNNQNLDELIELINSVEREFNSTKPEVKALILKFS